MGKTEEGGRTAYGQRLFTARRNAKLSQAALAGRVGTTQSNVAELERSGQGSAYTPLFAEVCAVSALWLAEGKGLMRQSAADSRPEQDAPLRDETSEADFLAYFRSQPLGRMRILLSKLKTITLEAEYQSGGEQLAPPPKQAGGAANQTGVDRRKAKVIYIHSFRKYAHQS